MSTLLSRCRRHARGFSILAGRDYWFPAIMPTLPVTQSLNAPLEQVWHLLIDTAAWPHWGPTVRAVDSPERFIEAGLRGRVRTTVGIWLPFEILTFAPQRYWDWRVGGVNATGHQVEPAGPDRCRLTFTVPVWAAPYRIVCRAALKRIERLLAETAGGDWG